MKNFFKKLCQPAKLYFSIELITSLYGLFKGVTLLAILVKLLFAFIWTYGLNILCKNGYKTFAWFIVLLPLILMFFITLRIIRLSRFQKNMLINEDQMEMVQDMNNMNM